MCSSPEKIELILAERLEHELVVSAVEEERARGTAATFLEVTVGPITAATAVGPDEPALDAARAERLPENLGLDQEPLEVFGKQVTVWTVGRGIAARWEMHGKDTIIHRVKRGDFPFNPAGCTHRLVRMCLKSLGQWRAHV